MQTLTWRAGLSRLAIRRELRYALLAAMETCWVYVVLAFVAALTQSPQTASALSLFGAYWIALLAGRALPRLERPWIELQGIAVAIALLTLLVIVRIDLYGGRAGWLDLSWLPRYVRSLLGFDRGLSGEFLTTFAVVYMFVRGLGFAQRPLTLWFVGFQFRLGIVAFFFVFLAAGILGSFDAGAWVMTYFALSLLAIALARMEELESSVRLGPRWALTLVAAVACVIVLGLGLVQFLTLDAANAFFRLLEPVFAVVGALVWLLLIPVGLLAEWLVTLLMPVLLAVRARLEFLGDLLPAEMENEVEESIRQSLVLEWLGPVLKTLVVLAVVLGVGILLARALHRRMQLAEQEAYRRESIRGDEQVAGVLESRRSKKAPRRRWSLAAETIRRIYAALVARAAEAGLPRRVAETPYEFLPRLKRAWPEEAEQVQAITEAYVAVHYAEQAATPEQVSRVRQAWRELEGVIRKKRGRP